MRSDVARPGISPAAGDVLVAAACLAVTLVALFVSDEPGARPPDVGAVVLLSSATAPLVWRRRWPVAVAVVATVTTLVYLLSGYPGGPSALPSLVALYTLAALGLRSWAMALVVVFAGVGVAYRAVVENDPPVAIVISAALYVLVLLLGEVVNSRRALQNEVQERLRAAAAKRETEAQRRIAEERLRIARDVHDVVAHTLAGVGVQAAVAADLLDDDPERARAALSTLRVACNDAVGELHAAIAPFRDDGPASVERTVPGLVGLRDLGERLSSDTLRVAVDVEPGTGAEVAENVQLVAYRVVQEALTNVVRHADARSARVAIRMQGPVMVVTVEDDGVGPTADSLGGFGLLGMRERVEVVGGTLEAGLSGSGGFRVEARLPVGGGG